MDCKTFPDDSSSSRNEIDRTHHQSLKLSVLWQGRPVTWPPLLPVRPSTTHTECRTEAELQSRERSMEVLFRHLGPVSRQLSRPTRGRSPDPTLTFLNPMSPALFFLTSLRTVAKHNQLVRFKMASTAATVNAVRFPV